MWSRNLRSNWPGMQTLRATALQRATGREAPEGVPHRRGTVRARLTTVPTSTVAKTMASCPGDAFMDN